MTGGQHRLFQFPSWRISMVGWKGEGVTDGEMKKSIQRRVLEGVTAGWLSYSPLANLCEVLCQPVQGLRFRQNIPHNDIHDGARGGRKGGGDEVLRLPNHDHTEFVCAWSMRRCMPGRQRGGLLSSAIIHYNTRRPLCHPLPSGNRSYTHSSRIPRKQFRMA